MKYKRIQLNNYRCFLHADVAFDHTPNKPITLFLGTNGSGKSELLFAFWWVLYGIDFSTFKGKGSTPYSLNTDLHYELMHEGQIGDERECSVTLDFESKNITYRVKRTHIFQKTAKEIILKSEKMLLSEQKHSGGWEIISEDSGQINTKLESIIPKNLLYGIIFDGENMKLISNADQKSKNTIQGVIQNVTNIELITDSINIFEKLKNKTTTLLKKLGKDTGNLSIVEVTKKISEYESDIDANKLTIEDNEKEIDNHRAELISLQAILSEAKETRELFEKRKLALINKSNAEKLEQEEFANFQASLRKGYLLLANPLLNEVLNNIDILGEVPPGLTVSAAKSILQDSTCICGKPIDENARQLILKLIDKLPPTNINSNIHEMITSMKEKIQNTDDEITTAHAKYDSHKKTKAKFENEIKGYSLQLGEIDNDELVKLGAQEATLKLKIKNLAENNKKLHEENKTLGKEHEKLKKAQNKIADKNSGSRLYNAKINIYNKYITALKAIQEKKKKEALDIINDKIQLAYEELSEDYEKGRRLVIGKYSPDKKYSFIPYRTERFYKDRKKKQSSGALVNEFDNYKRLNMSEEEAIDRIDEKIKINNSDSGSPGQKAIETLSFVKAILQYSTQSANTLLSQQVNYPLIIDSPFSDVGDENLSKASKSLHSFAEQIIYLSTTSSYSLIEDNLKNSINKIYLFDKNKQLNNSNIIKEE